MSDFRFCKDCKYFHMTSIRNLCGVCTNKDYVYHTYADSGECYYFEPIEKFCYQDTDCFYVVKEICEKSDCNSDCIFNNGKYKCLLCNCPTGWDIEEIKRRLNKKYGK